MKFISWNVNGIRACVQKGFMDFFKEADQVQAALPAGDKDAGRAACT